MQFFSLFRGTGCGQIIFHRSAAEIKGWLLAIGRWREKLNKRKRRTLASDGDRRKGGRKEAKKTRSTTEKKAHDHARSPLCARLARLCTGRSAAREQRENTSRSRRRTSTNDWLMISNGSLFMPFVAQASRTCTHMYTIHRLGTAGRSRDRSLRAIVLASPLARFLTRSHNFTHNRCGRCW